MRVLVTGSAGMLGFALRESAPAGVTMLGADLPATDITDADGFARALQEARPAAVINAAAFTNVDACETQEAAATAVNGTGAGVVAAACAAAAIPLLHVSTDYVFDGRIPAPGEYSEEDATGPLSAYGRGKLLGEQLVRERCPRHWIVRTQWLYGSHGKNFVDTMLKLASERDELAVVDDQVGSPTSTHDLAPVLWLMLGLSPPHGTYHASNAGSCSWHGFAAEIFRQSASAVTLKRQSTAQLGRPAPRPARSVLCNARLRAALGTGLPPWQDGLQRYLRRRAAQGVAP
jgi:dTDP-4-dehydrorhamnose reductase